MNYVQNQNGNVLQETLAVFNSDDVKAILRRLHCFKITLPCLQVLQKSVPIPLVFVTRNREYIAHFYVCNPKKHYNLRYKSKKF